MAEKKKGGIAASRIPARHMLITGASGYIGRHLVQHAIRKGWRVTALGRQPTKEASGFLPFDLAGWLPSLPLDAVVLIHLAADTGRSHVPEDVEIGTGMALADAARSAGMRIIFASSQAARPDAPTRYGRVKWAIEEVMLARGGTVIRPGLVYGGREVGGLYASLVEIVTRFPVLPALRWPTPLVQPVHVDDLCEAIVALAEGEAAGGRSISLGSERPVTFTAFLRAIGRYRVRRPRLFIPLPAWPIALGMRLVGKVMSSVEPFAERTISLIRLKPMETTADHSLAGVNNRPLENGLHPRGSCRRRKLAAEGAALLSYLTADRAYCGPVARYVRAIEQLEGGCPLQLPAIVLRLPWLLAIIERNRRPTSGHIKQSLDARLDIALAIAETSLVYVDAFFVRQARPLPVAAMQLVIVMASEALIQAGRAGGLIIRRIWSEQVRERKNRLGSNA